MNTIKKFISQKGQDKWVINDVFNYKKNGYFVDLAATDGIKNNNTYLLEKNLNWKGICIEPNPKFHSNLRKNRKCLIYTDPIDGENDTVIDFRVDNGPGGGIVDDDTDNNYKIRGNQLRSNKAKIVKMKTKTLEYILDQSNAPKIIDYLSFDVEGAETRILRNFPFEKYTFLSMTIERPTVELNNLLFSKGYVFVKNSVMDSYYVHKTIENFENIKKEPFEQIPPKDW